MKIYDYKGRKNLCGNRVKEARARLNITQTDLAARLQVAGITMERDSVSRIEIGTRFVTDYELAVLAACNSQTTSPFGCLNNFYFKILSNFSGSLQ